MNADQVKEFNEWCHANGVDDDNVGAFNAWNNRQEIIEKQARIIRALRDNDNDNKEIL